MKVILSLALVGVIAAASPVAAKPKHEHERHADCRFEPADVVIVREYYEPRYKPLPPGLAKKYYRTGHLPPGWQKKMEPIPVVVERRLTPLPDGYRRGYIDGAVVVYSPRTQIMIDVMMLQ